jgi:hypothetical protein
MPDLTIVRIAMRRFARDAEKAKCLTFLKDLREVDLDTVESLPLRFMDGHSPRQDERQLEATVNLVDKILAERTVPESCWPEPLHWAALPSKSPAERVPS